MTSPIVPATRPIEPLFASHERLWLRVWASTQAAAIVLGTYLTVDGAGGIGALLASPRAPRVLAGFAALVAYHVIGYRASDWILRRRWAVGLFVPLGWALIVGPLQSGWGFALLIFGAVIQGFVFLPFAWAIGVLAIVVAVLLVSVAPHGNERWTGLIVARVASLVATGVMIGTVMLYIHRVNRDAAVRARLLRELDAAQRDLAQRAREAGVQDERQRLAQDLHDTLAQGFTSVIKHLEAAELSFAGTVPDDPTPDDPLRAARPHLAHAQAVSRASLAEIRRLVWALHPPQLAEAPLAAAIERIVAQWGEANAVATTCTLDPSPALRPEADVIFLRAVQESLSNVARHAAATRVGVTMHCVDGVVLLSIEDDGRGFIDTDATDTMGIAGMRARVRRFGGHVLIDSAPGAGTSVTVAMPLAAIAA